MTGLVLSGIPKTMRALCKTAPRRGLELREVPVPQCGPSDVLIRVEMAGVCGSDQHIYNWDSWAQRHVKPPQVIGHEFMGRIADIGGSVQSVAVGDRVSGEGHIVDGTCTLCRIGEAHICENVQIIGVDRDGAFAEYLCLPARNVWKLDPAIPDEVAAVFDPLGNAVHCVMEAGVSIKSVLITGVGSIGLMAIMVARAAGASEIFAVDVNPKRLELAKKFGATATFLSNEPDLVQKLRAATNGDGPDVLLEMSGNPQALDVGLQAIRNGARVALLGIPPDAVSINLADRVIFKGLTMLGIFGRRIFETWNQMQALVRTGRVDLREIITDVLPLEKFEQAFEFMREGKGIKIVFRVKESAS